MPAQRKAPWHRGTFHVDAKRVRAAAYANPATRCQRCGRTLAQHPRTKTTGRPPRWSAGHVRDSEVRGKLRPEVLGCNSSAGAAYGNRNRPRRRTTVRVASVTALRW